MPLCCIKAYDIYGLVLRRRDKRKTKSKTGNIFRYVDHSDDDFQENPQCVLVVFVLLCSLSSNDLLLAKN